MEKALSLNTRVRTANQFALVINLSLDSSLLLSDVKLKQECSFSWDLLKLGLTVGESDVEFLCALDDVFSLECWDVLGDFPAISSVVHEQQFNVFFVSDQKLSESTGKHVASSFGLLLTDLWHCAPTTVATALRIVDTSWSSPWVLNTHKLDQEKTRGKRNLESLNSRCKA